MEKTQIPDLLHSMEFIEDTPYQIVSKMVEGAGITVK
jgi:hypothetical protein